MPDAASTPRPEKKALEERVCRLVGRSVDQVWYREIEHTGPEEERPDNLPVWQRGEGFEQVFMDFYLVTGETTFRVKYGGVHRMAGLDVTAHPEAILDAFEEYGTLTNVSEASGWRKFVGGRIAEARLFWHWRDYGIGHWQCPRDLALTFDDGRTVYVTTSALGSGREGLEQLSTVFDEETAEKHAVGPHAAPEALPEDAVRIPPEAPGPWVIEALPAGGLEGQTVRRVWRAKTEDRRRRKPSRWREQTMPDVPLSYEVIRRALYLATDEHLFRLSWGLEPKCGVYASRNPVSDDAASEDLSGKEPWSVLVGQRVSGVRCYWRWHETGERRICIPRDLEITLEDGYRLYLSAAHPGKHEEDVSYLNQLTAYHGERAAWQFQIGPFADGAHPTGPA